MRVLVTGATGFLASSLIPELVRAGFEVFGGVRTQPAQVSGWTPVQLDLLDAAGIQHAVKSVRPEAIYHCAAYGVDARQKDGDTAVAVNVLGTHRLYEAAVEQGVRRFVHVGTGYEYGSHPGLISEAAALSPVGLYGATKAAGSVLLLSKRFGESLRPVVFRPFAMFGPGEGEHKLVPQIIQAARARKVLELTAGDEARDYLFVGDVTRVLTAVGGLSDGEFPAGEVYNLCSGQEVTVRDFSRAIAEELGAVEWMRWGSRPARTDVPRRMVGDPSRWMDFARQIGHEELTRLTPLTRALEQMRVKA